MPHSELADLDQVEIETTINGKALKCRVKARQHLADFLRHELELTVTHLGCEHGACAACTVLIDGRTSRGCLVLAAQIHGKAVLTVEGLSASGELEPLQQAFLTRNAAQCGFCTSGMLLTAYELIAQARPMSRDDIRDYISGNMCRCTGYHAIVDAIESLMLRQPAAPV